jgi:excisionase family DNA binding protein
LTIEPTEPAFLSRHEAAKWLGGLHIATIDRLIRDKKITIKKVGRRTMVRLDSLKRFAEEEVA